MIDPAFERFMEGIFHIFHWGAGLIALVAIMIYVEKLTKKNKED